MARTKTEIIKFLDTLVGRIPQHSAPFEDLSGQCVTGVKVLMDFLGVPNPYSARGNAKDVNDTLLRQGIAQEGKGWLTIVVNRDMGYIGGVHYGHIWMDLKDTANYESNGAKALYMTKNTRPISQGQQFVNLDKYIKENKMTTEDEVRFSILGVTGQEPMNNYEQEVKYWTGRDPLEFARYLNGLGDYYMVPARERIKKLEAELASATAGFEVATVYVKKSTK